MFFKKKTTSLLVFILFLTSAILFNSFFHFQTNTASASTPVVFNNTSTGRTGTIQTWTVPTTGTYKITAYGAGFNAVSNQKGAQMSGEFSLTQGQQLKILVGQMGQHARTGSGGSFVTLSDNTPLIIAGGAGGYEHTDSTNIQGTTDALGNRGAQTVDRTSAAGQGGDYTGTTSAYPTGGGGLLTQGKNKGVIVNHGGRAFVDGGDGGTGATGYDGGFGGGGALSNSATYRVSGGGGYSGGMGSYGTSGNYAGGGGSYNAGTNQINASGVRAGHGLVEIEALSSAPLEVPTPVCSGGYCTIAFTGVGTYNWDVPAGITTADVLVVGGGGGGGADFAGGGGGGGVRSGTVNISSSVAVIVGSGGMGGAQDNNGSNGTDSSFGTLVATGGGGGSAGSNDYVNAGSTGGGHGGSGGGAGGYLEAAKLDYGLGNTPVTSPVQGYNGGLGYFTVAGAASGGGGGGGGGAAGGNSTSSKAGDGGAGFLSSITGSAVYYAGGGGGGGYLPFGASGGLGGQGGGGNGGTNASENGFSGQVNTGGGGGGNAGGGSGNGGNGGSGIVIVRYLDVVDLDFGLVSHWTMDQADYSGSTLLDKTPNANNLTNYSATFTIDRNTESDKAMNFGTRSNTYYLSAANHSSLQITENQTIAMWLKPTNLAAGRQNPYNKAYGGEGTITQEIGGTLNYYYGTAGTNASPYQGFTMTNSLVDNEWVHVVLVRDLSAMKLRWYKNGVLTDETDATYAVATASTLPLEIGRGYAGNYEGLIDDVRVYNRALSATEVAELFNLTDIPTCSSNICQLDAGSSLKILVPSGWDGDDSYEVIITGQAGFKKLFIPFNSATEWARFRLHYPSHITLESSSGLLCGVDSVTHGGINYGTVSRGGLCWLDRNLGASRVPTSRSDSEGYGDYFQWGRGADGHQLKTSGTTATRSSTDTPGHANFITTSASPNDWRDPQNTNLWQGVSGVNNPCPTGWRVPTQAELNAEALSWSASNYTGAYDSTLKWPTSGYRNNNGTVYAGSYGYAWTINPSDATATSRGLYINQANFGDYVRAFGFPVRCVK